LRKRHATTQEHVAQNWEPVLRKRHATTQA
jgi:hypothetical protein